jgi:molybdopterin/thiamine biosynthesis adenylyltransferase
VGSLIAEYLGHLGVGHIILIDPDRLDLTNRPRVVGARPWDALPFLRRPLFPAWVHQLAGRWATPKVDIAARVIRSANPAATITPMRCSVQDPAAATALPACDYIFLSADSMTARLVVNQVVHQYFVPAAQVGSKVSTDRDTGAVTNVFSIVRPVTPQSGCLWCNQLIDPARLQDEAQTDAERKANRYIDEPEVVAPSVITLNAVGAAHAANDFMFFMTGLTLPEASPSYFRHTPALRKFWLDDPRRDAGCIECGQSSRSRFGRGDARKLTLRAA